MGPGNHPTRKCQPLGVASALRRLDGRKAIGKRSVELARKVSEKARSSQVDVAQSAPVARGASHAFSTIERLDAGPRPRVVLLADAGKEDQTLREQARVGAALC